LGAFFREKEVVRGNGKRDAKGPGILKIGKKNRPGTWEGRGRKKNAKRKRTRGEGKGKTKLGEDFKEPGNSRQKNG